MIDSAAVNKILGGIVQYNYMQRKEVWNGEIYLES